MVSRRTNLNSDSNTVGSDYANKILALPTPKLRPPPIKRKHYVEERVEYPDLYSRMLCVGMMKTTLDGQRGIPTANLPWLGMVSAVAVVLLGVYLIVEAFRP